MNRLGSAASAYLRSAAHQPVHWHPWGPEAFEAARTANRPILLDIGAVWCHWCHVMDGESYEDPALAEYLNGHFVCVKVDRDERPDVDARYQRAVQAFSGQGGWPLTAFLTPTGEAFYGGTYFPPDGKFGRPGFRTVLEQVATVFHGQPGQVAAQAASVTRLVQSSLDETAPGDVSPALLDGAVQALARVFDFRNGGFGQAPKFPHPGAVEFLLHRWRDAPAPVVREMVEKKLLGMAQGGFHDHLAGGFHRYSVDAQWIVPHFEKMASDNAGLLAAYAGAAAALGNAGFAATARGVIRWIREVLSDPEGGYGASQDADVGLHDDGDYFTWTRDEAAAVLGGTEFDVAAAYWDIGTAGEMQHHPGKNVLYAPEPLARVSARLGLAEADARAALERAAAKLLEARQARPAPYVDRTRYTGWNAMVASALLRAGPLVDEPWAGGHALATLARLRRESPDPDAVLHAPGGTGGLLDDQVHAAAAALDAWEFSGDPAWLAWAEALMERVWREYRDEAGGGLFDTAHGRGGEGLLPSRAKPAQDAPTPSPNGVAALVAARLAHLGAGDAWRERHGEQVRVFGGAARDLGLHGATLLLAVDWWLNPPAHLVIVGPAGDPEAARMHRRALATWFPRRVIQRLTPATARDRPLPEALRAMLEGTAAPRAYLCIGTACRLPAASEAAWEGTLRDAIPAP